MSWGGHTSYPRAILHIDGDAFFASCEVAKNPKLRGLPVITGKERGIVSACTYEAKARGVKRGVQLSEALKACPDAIVLPSDYETYSLFSQRMYDIVRRYTPMIEEYSIDECFADLTGLRRRHHMSYPSIAEAIQRDLHTELGMTFSLGLSATKTLSKIGSKWKKPAGLTLLPMREASQFLAKTRVGQVWGIGHNTEAMLEKYGIRTAQEFVSRDEEWVMAHLSKPFQETWRELKGEVVYDLDVEGRQSYQSISKTKTFTPPSRDPSFVFSQLSKNIENACIKARRWNLVAPRAYIFLKTQDFKYYGCEIDMPHPSNVPQDFVLLAQKFFPKLFNKKLLYRSTGITLVNLAPVHEAQLDLFGAVDRTEKMQRALKSVDDLSARYGKHAVFLGSSFKAMKFGAHLGARGDMPQRVSMRFKGETLRRRLGVPMLGEVG